MGISFLGMKVDEELKSLVDAEAESMGLTQLAASTFRSPLPYISGFQRDLHRGQTGNHQVDPFLVIS
jgi:hypothetical protein